MNKKKMGLWMAALCASGYMPATKAANTNQEDDVVKTMMQPGAIAEIMPDYGCPVQAWTMYGMAPPLIRYIYGIQPEAYKKTITFCPDFPDGWDEMEIFPIFLLAIMSSVIE